MKIMERNVLRLAAVQHLRTAFGIKTKNWNKNKASGCKMTANDGYSVKVFGVPLESLPQRRVVYGDVPCFLVDACSTLQEHIDTEGLFRKSGSIVRLKALRAKLDLGEECLSTALPCDVAGLVKQFFRELPEPVLPAELQESFLRAQQLSSAEDRVSATLLLSCVLPHRNLTLLQYFFSFLYDVSQRSAANKMDSSNLSVILAPNLLHAGDGTEKMNANTEKRLRLQAAVVLCLIDNAQDVGVVPGFLMEKVPAMLGCELLSPSLEEPEELDSNSGMKRRRRRSLGDMVSGALNKLKTSRTPTHSPLSDRCVFSSATPVIMTPNIKRKLPLEAGHSYGFSNKKRRSIKKTLDPSVSTMNTSQNPLASAGPANRQAASSGRRRSRRLSNRHAVSRVDSGKAGCFSPKVTKKEAVRKSLRLRFSLGRSSRETGSEGIGLRLATQERTSSICSTVLTPRHPALSSTVPRDSTSSRGSRFISKSEDNLLTPQCEGGSQQPSWSGDALDALGFSSFTDTPMSACLKSTYYSSEPAIVTSKPPAIVTSKPPAAAGRPPELSCSSRAESPERQASLCEARAPTGPTLLKIRRAFSVSATDLQGVLADHSPPAGGTKPQPSKTSLCPGPMRPPPQPYTPMVVVLNKDFSGFPTPQRALADDQNITFGQMEMVRLSPLHIDSTLFEFGLGVSPGEQAGDGPLTRVGVGNCLEEECGEDQNSSRLIDALDIQSPAHFQLKASSGFQSTPYRASRLGLLHDCNSPLPSAKALLVPEPDDGDLPGAHSPQQQPASSVTLETHRLRVAEHIQRFNKLTLYSPQAQAAMIRSPLKFQRTPVRQSVRRINSLLGERGGRAGRAVSLEGGLSAGPQLQPCQGPDMGVWVAQDRVCPSRTRPPVPPTAPKPRPGALGDRTNQVPSRADAAPCRKTSGGQGSTLQLLGKEEARYRGSPRQPLNDGRLLSATKPIDL
ncbi:rho GTPase-activating protein 11A isoform X2 [Hypomesus transpacificus]|uniref:rho GTPase-activating protein 11A isoform X2 n=1 Tax=Hypomesus transpacificus TaxID=137520 RepID=UPI001F0843AB|nr:rho GTPase-activating protein 11A isoform X2 [Hypomesus transpacificus]